MHHTMHVGLVQPAEAPTQTVERLVKSPKTLQGIERFACDRHDHVNFAKAWVLLSWGVAHASDCEFRLVLPLVMSPLQRRLAKRPRRLRHDAILDHQEHGRNRLGYAPPQEASTTVCQSCANSGGGEALRQRGGPQRTSLTGARRRSRCGSRSSCPGLITGITYVSSSLNAARLGVPHAEDALQMRLNWRRTGKFLDMNPKQQKRSDAVMATFTKVIAIAIAVHAGGPGNLR